jgi:protein-L-isoaspartate(D-aspartate) O-methyltransferase
MKTEKSSAPRHGDHSRARERMVREQVIGRGIQDQRVIAALRKVPRHLFVPEAFLGRAYGDSALPIGDGQTISQPFIVAYMTQALDLKGKERVLEIGTGSGYQTAILAELAERVYSVERNRALLDRARKALDQIHCRNVVTRLFDGSYGWAEEGPFDAILVTAGAPAVPEPLLKQLKVGGRLMIPIGERTTQKLVRVCRRSRGFSEEKLMACSFVALVGAFGWKERERYDPYSPQDSL